MNGKLCRFCLSLDSECIDLFGNEGRRYNITTKLVSCLRYEVKEDDILSKAICKSCLNMLETSHAFYQKCREAQEKLVATLKGNPEDISQNNLIEVSKVCRLCAQQVDSGIVIFSASGIECNIVKKIDLCINIPVYVDDQFPKNICVSCATTLDKVHYFFQKCYSMLLSLKWLSTTGSSVADNAQDASVARSTSTTGSNSGVIKYARTECIEAPHSGIIKIEDCNGNCDNFTIKTEDVQRNLPTIAKETSFQSRSSNTKTRVQNCIEELVPFVQDQPDNKTTLTSDLDILKYTSNEITNPFYLMTNEVKDVSAINCNAKFDENRNKKYENESRCHKDIIQTPKLFTNIKNVNISTCRSGNSDTIGSTIIDVVPVSVDILVRKQQCISKSTGYNIKTTLQGGQSPSNYTNNKNVNEIPNQLEDVSGSNTNESITARNSTSTNKDLNLTANYNIQIINLEHEDNLPSSTNLYNGFKAPCCNSNMHSASFDGTDSVTKQSSNGVNVSEPTYTWSSAKQGGMIISNTEKQIQGISNTLTSLNEKQIDEYSLRREAEEYMFKGGIDESVYPGKSDIGMNIEDEFMPLEDLRKFVSGDSAYLNFRRHDTRISSSEKRVLNIPMNKEAMSEDILFQTSGRYQPSNEVTKIRSVRKRMTRNDPTTMPDIQNSINISAPREYPKSSSNNTRTSFVSKVCTQENLTNDDDDDIVVVYDKNENVHAELYPPRLNIERKDIVTATNLTGSNVVTVTEARQILHDSDEVISVTYKNIQRNILHDGGRNMYNNSVRLSTTNSGYNAKPTLNNIHADNIMPETRNIYSEPNNIAGWNTSTSIPNRIPGHTDTHTEGQPSFTDRGLLPTVDMTRLLNNLHVIDDHISRTSQSVIEINGGNTEELHQTGSQSNLYPYMAGENCSCKDCLTDIVSTHVLQDILSRQTERNIPDESQRRTTTDQIPKQLFKPSNICNAPQAEPKLSPPNVPSIKNYTCNLCDRKFSSKYYLRIHLNMHSILRPYTCHICSKAFVKKENLLRHMQIHRKGHDLFCNACKKSFLTQNSFRKHLEKHGSANKYKYNTSTKAPATGKETLKNFRYERKGKSLMEAPGASVTLEQQRKRRPKLTTKVPLKKICYVCNLCKNAFNKKQDLTIHLKLHAESKRFPCKLCKNMFSKKEDLKLHLKLHAESKRFVCNVCYEEFKTRAGMILHLRSHTRKKGSYLCRSCNKSFINQAFLMRHFWKVHRNERKRFCCTFCCKAFRTEQSLSLHLKLHKQ